LQIELIISKLPPKAKLTIFSLTILFLFTAVAQRKHDPPVVGDFEQRVQQYLDTHKATHVAIKPSGSAAKIDQEKHQARQKIKQARPNAKQGAIFTPAISAYFREQLAQTLQGPEGARIRASLRHAEPLPNLRLKVNSRYPGNLPLQSTPPTLLANLPQLPRELEYRIVGQTLVLCDVSSDLIADLLPNAIPDHGEGKGK
jgi:hypothetical protein